MASRRMILDVDIHSVAVVDIFEGAKISYRRIGRGARKILFFHGFPGSSAQAEMFQPYAESHDLDVICLDRPGYNRSEIGSGSQIAQTLRAIRRVLAQVGWDEFEILTVSGGTPFGIAYAREYPRNIGKLTIVSGLGPISAPGFDRMLTQKSKLALRMLPLVPGRLLSNAVAMITRDDGTAASPHAPPRTSSLLNQFLPVSEPDMKCIAESSSARSVLRRGLKEAFLQNARGPQNDARIYLSPWSLDLSEFTGAVTFWHGGKDLILPVRMSHLMSEALPNSKLHILEDEGHYSLAIKNIGLILNP